MLRLRRFNHISLCSLKYAVHFLLLPKCFSSIEMMCSTCTFPLRTRPKLHRILHWLIDILKKDYLTLSLLVQNKELDLSFLIFVCPFWKCWSDFLCVFAQFSAKIVIFGSWIKTILDSRIQSFDARRLIVWILGINKPIAHCVKNNCFWIHYYIS